MSAKKIGIYFASDSLDFLSVLTGDENSVESLGISTATNLSIQIAAMAVRRKLPLTADELLYACKIFEGKSVFEEHPSADAVHIEHSILSLRRTLHSDSVQASEDPQLSILRRSTLAFTSDLWLALIFVIRLYWTGRSYSTFKSIDEVTGDPAWAQQFIIEAPANTNNRLRP